MLAYILLQSLRILQAFCSQMDNPREAWKYDFMNAGAMSPALLLYE